MALDEAVTTGHHGAVGRAVLALALYTTEEKP
jgi:hypothetical protein